MKEQLLAEVGTYLEKMSTRRNINPPEVTELFDFWKRITNETTYCNTCSNLVSEIFGKVKRWHEREMEKIPVADPFEEGSEGVYAKPYTKRKYTKKK